MTFFQRCCLGLLLGAFLGGGLIRCGGDDAGLSSSPNGPEPGGKLHALTVNRYVTAEIDSTEVDVILSNATSVLQTKDAETDVACEVMFARSGAIGTFQVGDGIVNSEEDFKAMLAVPGQVKVVHQINWCGAFKPNIIGCASTPGQSFVVTRYQTGLEGILWSHEFAHNKGQVHRDEPGAIMNAVMDGTNRQVNETECAALMQ